MKPLKFILLFFFTLNASISPAIAQSNQSGSTLQIQIVLAIIFLTGFFYLGMSVKTISGNTAFVIISTFREYTGVVGPGLHFVPWIIQNIEETFPSTQVSIGVNQLVTAVRGENYTEYNERVSGLSENEKMKNPILAQSGEVTIDSPTILINFPKKGMIPDSQLIDIAKVWPSVPGEFASEQEKLQFQKVLEDIFGDFLEDIFQEAVKGHSWYSIYLNRQEVVNKMNEILENRVSSSSGSTTGRRDPVYLLSLIPSNLIQLTTGQLNIPTDYRQAIESLGTSSLEAATKITETEGEKNSLMMLIQIMQQDPELALALKKLDIHKIAAEKGTLNLNEYSLDPAIVKALTRIISPKKD